MDAERTSREDRKADEKFAQQGGNVGLQNGSQLQNFVSDQIIVISLLNKIPASRGGSAGRAVTMSSLRIGFCAPGLHQAILAFQQANSPPLPGADGWVSPTGPTIRLLKAIAENKALGSSSGGPDLSEFFSKLDEIIALGRALQRPSNIKFIPAGKRGRLAQLLNDLERNLTAISPQRSRGTVPTQNSLAGVAVVTILAAMVGAMLVVMAMFADPAFRKSFPKTMDNFVNGILDRTVNLNILIEQLKILMFITLASVITNITSDVSNMSKTINSCGDKFIAFRAATIALRAGMQGPQSSLEFLFDIWIRALRDLIVCLKKNGHEIEVIRLASLLGSPVLDGEFTFIEFVVKSFLKGIFPSLFF